MAVSAFNGVLGSLIGKLGAFLEEEYKLMKGVKGEIRFLKAELETMNAFMQELAKLEEPNALVKDWMMQVRELAYDIEDSIDEFVHCIETDPTKSHGFKGFIHRSMRLMTTTNTRRIAHELKDLKARAIEVHERHQRYKLDAVVPSPSSNLVAMDPRLPALYAEASSLVGIDGPRDELVSWLIEGDDQLAKRKVLSIVGFGGLGKTTLAMAVYRHLKGQFQCHAFVSVSQSLNLKKLLSNICLEVGANGSETQEEGQLINELREFLQNRR